MKSKTKVLFLLTLLIIFLFSSLFSSRLSNDFIANNNYLEFNEKDQVQINQSGFWDLTGDPIYIDDLATGVGAQNWTWAETQPWCSGSGSWTDPFVIENVTIDGQGSDICIEIRNSNVYFIIRNSSLYNSGSSSYDAAVSLNNVDNGKIVNNNCSDNIHYGIYLRESNNNTLSGNTVINNGYDGICLRESNENTLSGNTVNNNGFGIYLNWHCYNNRLLGNTATDNMIYGICLWDCDNNTLSGNTINNSYQGLVLKSSDYNTLTGNIASNSNEAGIFLEYGANNIISGNTAINNDFFGIRLYNNINSTLSGNLMYNSGIYLDGSLINLVSHSIDNTNLVNNKPVYYYVNEIGLGSSNFTDAGQIILINCNNSIISGFNLSSGSTGVFLGYSNSNNLLGNIVNSNYEGILLYESDNNTLSGNSANHNRYSGIHLWNSDNNTLSANIVDNSNYGIYIMFSDNNSLLGNNASYNYDGIDIYGSDTNKLLGNIGNDNEYGIIIDDSNNNTLLGNVLNSDERGIILRLGKNNNLSENIMNFCGIEFSAPLADLASHSIDNTNLVNNKPVYYYVNELSLGSSNFTNAGQIILINCNNSIISELNISDGSGIYLGYSNNNTLSGITTSNNNNEGIYLQYSNDNKLFGNIANNNNYGGINLDSSNNNTISGNTAINNADSGISLGLSNDNALSGNIAISNYRGISLDYSNNNTLSGNTVNNNYRGIYLGYSHNNMLSGNIVSNNNDYGLRLDYNSNRNKIILNDFINNGINAEDDAINTMWDNGTIGNYWDDYEGDDVNLDGIGDTPYLISGTAGSQDNFPIWRDTTAPVITIIFPLGNSIFGLDAPIYQISINELNLDTIWYTLDRGETNYIITSLTGTINQTAWDALSEGGVIIRFYANDTYGNISSRYVLVYFEIPEDLEDTPEISFGNFYILFTFITILSFIILEKRKKK